MLVNSLEGSAIGLAIKLTFSSSGNASRDLRFRCAGDLLALLLRLEFTPSHPRHPRRTERRTVGNGCSKALKFNRAGNSGLETGNRWAGAWGDRRKIYYRVN